MPLTNSACKSAKPSEKPRKLSDGKGLYLEVMPTGSKYWRLKYRFLGKENRLALGVYPEVTLKEARDLCDEARKLLNQNINPSEAKKEAKRQLRAEHINSFEEIAKQWLEHKKSDSSERYCKTILNRLELNLFPEIGKLPITSVTAVILLDALKLVEARGVFETTKRLRQYSNQIFDYAIANGLIENNPALHITKALKTKKVEHQKALPLEELPELLRRIDKNDARLYPQTRLALKLLILTFTRKKELAHAKWEEVNFEDKVWIIPAERMKMKKEHLVPLSKQSLEILKELHKLNENWDYVFPSQISPRKPMNEDTILRALYKLGYKGTATIHGFRALAMSTIMEKLGYRYEVPDRQLAHSRGNNVKAAYDRAEFLEDRIRMMQDWADYVEGLYISHKELENV